MKKYIAILIGVIILMLIFTGCGGQSNNVPVNQLPSSQSESKQRTEEIPQASKAQNNKSKEVEAVMSSDVIPNNLRKLASFTAKDYNNQTKISEAKECYQNIKKFREGMPSIMFEENISEEKKQAYKELENIVFQSYKYSELVWQHLSSATYSEHFINEYTGKCGYYLKQYENWAALNRK